MTPFQKIMNGLQDALAYIAGDKSRGHVRRPEPATAALDQPGGRDVCGVTAPYDGPSGVVKANHEDGGNAPSKSFGTLSNRKRAHERRP